MKTLTMGTGITAREVELVPATPEGLKAYIREPSDELSRAGDAFCSRVADIEAWAAEHDKARKARAEPVGEEDSLNGYALRFLRWIGAARESIAEGDAASAARFAFDLGIAFNEMLMKLEWEHAALVGVGRKQLADRMTEIKEHARVLRVCLAAELWKESKEISTLTKRRIGIVCDWMGKGESSDPIAERTLDEYLAEARAQGVLAD